MNTQQIKEIILKELPVMIQQDPEIRLFIIQIASQQFADKRETESRFDQVLAEIRKEREEQTRKWEEHRVEDRKKWEEQKAEDRKKWEEHRLEDQKKWAEQKQLWEEHRAEDRKKWEEQKAEDRIKWEEQNKKWWKNQESHDEIIDSVKRLEWTYKGTIGALGARWGLYTEESFRNALAAILGEYLKVQVLNITEWDEAGEVFGRPDQIELDIIIKNGLLVICEIKSSVSKSDMMIFYRKARFYEKKYQQTANSIIVISPMVDGRARALADQLQIKVYSYVTEVEREILL